jgi:hypothetical protein
MIIFNTWLLLKIIAILLPVIAIIDIVRRDLLGINKLFWILIVLFFPFLGAIIYFAYRKPHKPKRY